MATQSTALKFSIRPFSNDARAEATRLLLVPASIGLLLGWFGASNADEGTRFVVTTIWIILSICTWITTDVFTRVVAGVLRRRGVRLVWSLMIGFVLAAPFNVVVNLSFGEIFQYWGVDKRGLEMLLKLNPTFVISSSLVPLTVWMIGNLLFREVKHSQLYGYRSPRADIKDAALLFERDSAPPTSPAFLNKVRPSLRGHVHAVCAELHYIRVFTEFGTDLVHYRFKDAVAELERSNGAQVHRSWAVCCNDILSVSATSVALSNGMTVPVGRSFKSNLRQSTIRGNCRNL